MNRAAEVLLQDLRQLAQPILSLQLEEEISQDLMGTPSRDQRTQPSLGPVLLARNDPDRRWDVDDGVRHEPVVVGQRDPIRVNQTRGRVTKGCFHAEPDREVVVELQLDLGDHPGVPDSPNALVPEVAHLRDRKKVIVKIPAVGKDHLIAMCTNSMDAKEGLRANCTARRRELLPELFAPTKTEKSSG